MRRFKIEEYPSQLNITQTWWMLLWLLVSRLVGLLVTLVAIGLFYEVLKAKSDYAYFVYGLPVVITFQLVKRLYTFYRRRTVSFIKHEDAIYQGRRLIGQLTAINRLELVYKSKSEDETVFLQLVINEETHFVLAETRGGPGSLTKLGVRIAKFLNVEFVNTNPLYDRIIWGGVNANESDIGFLENGM